MSYPAVFDYSDYKDYLRDLANEEPRGFRKKLAEWSNCQTAYITHVLNGSAHFNWEQVEAISNGLNHTNEEKEFFLLILSYSTAGTPSLRKFLKMKLDQLKLSHLSIKERVKVKETLSREDQAKYYSAWYFAAIHVMLTIPRFQSKEAIAKYLNLSSKIVSEVLEFLVSVGLAKRHGVHFTVGSNKLHLEKESPLISKHHANWRMASMRSIENGHDDDLHYSSVFTISEKDADKIRSLLVKAIETSVDVIRDSKEDRPLAMVIDLFQL